MSLSRVSRRFPAARAPEAVPRIAVVPVRHYGRAILASLVVILVAAVADLFATNKNILWSVVGHFLFDGAVLQGLKVTVELTGLGMIFGLIMAAILAVMRLSESRIISSVAWAYVFFFRTVPLIVLLIFIGNAGLFVKSIRIPVPFTHLYIYSGETQHLLTPFIASCVGLSICGSAYMSEVIRSGLIAVDAGQTQAAKALGLDRAKTLRYVTGPQALRVILPPMGNELIGMLKASALVSVIAGGDLLTVTEAIAGVTYRTIEMMIVATFWYLIIIGGWSVVQLFLERRYAHK